MVEIAPGVHKPLLVYFWVRTLEDGHTIECQFDLDTGEPRSWLPVPDKLTQVILYPVYQELSDLMAQWGEFGVPNSRPKVKVDLNKDKVITKVEFQRRFFWGPTHHAEQIIQVGEKPIWNLVNELHFTYYYLCSKCKNKFQLEGGAPLVCPACGIRNEWECHRCGEIKFGEYYCLDCGIKWKRDGEYKYGSEVFCPKCGLIAKPKGEIKTKPLFQGDGKVECPDCLEDGRIQGLVEIENLELKCFSWLETKHVIGIEGNYEQEIGDDEILRRDLS